MSAGTTGADGPDREPDRRLDVVVVGAGFSGLYALYRLRRMGLAAHVFEAGTDVGGTWYWNRYPGARCDVASMEYSFSFDPELEQEWTWSERYSPQPEIQRYLAHVADRHDLRRDISFETRVTSAHFDDERRVWRVETDRGELLEARFCIMATGCLSAARVPEIPGLERFGGPWYHSGRWPKDHVDFTGQRVGVVGTGSSGIQIIPEVAREAAHLFVFQRTPNFAIPARNHPLSEEEVARFKANYRENRKRAMASPDGMLGELPRASGKDDTPEERAAYFEARWNKGGVVSMLTTYRDLLTDTEVNETMGDFVRDKIRQRVAEPEVAEALMPHDHHIGTKRLCQEIDYFETFNRDNVTLLDIRRAPIEEILPEGIRTAAGTVELDAIIFATGYDAMTGPLLAIDITGTGARPLAEKWAPGPMVYLGLITSGFPNMFIITGPGSPSVKGNMVVSIEQHVEFVTDCIGHMNAHGLTLIDADPEAEAAWVEHVREVAERTLLPRAESWYVGANVPGKPRVFLPYLGGIPAYREICNEVAAEGYRGFVLQ